MSGSKEDCTKMDDEEHKPSFENVLEMLGMPGRYQLTQLSMTFLSKLIVTYMGLSFVFLGYAPAHVCSLVNETSLLLSNNILNNTEVKVTYHKCKISITTANDSSDNSHDVIGTSDCFNGRKFEKEGVATTYVSDWNLVCEKTGVAEWSQTIFNLGQIIGGLILSQMVDRFGRKPIYITCTILAFILEGLVIVAPSIYIIYAIKFFSGLSYQGVVTSYLVCGMELLVPRHRQIYGVFICYLWVFQVLTMGGIAYLFRDQNWRYIQGVVAASGVFCVIYPFIFNESPRWLAANGRQDEALDIIEQACRQNKKDFGKIKKVFESFIKEEYNYNNAPTPLVKNKEGCNDLELIESNQKMEFKAETVIVTSNEKQTILTLLCTKRLLFVTLITLYIWVTCNMTYYGLYMTSSSIAGDRFLNYILMGLVEIPSNMVILFMLNKMSRRFVLMFFMALSATSLLASSIFTSFVDGYGYISTILFIFGKFAITCAFNVVFIYTPEIFPTNLRGVGTGFCSCFGKIGSMVAPFLRPIYDIAPIVPGLIFTVMCALAFFLIPLLPETKDKDLPNKIDDIKREHKAKGKLTLK